MSKCLFYYKAENCYYCFCRESEMCCFVCLWDDCDWQRLTWILYMIRMKSITTFSFSPAYTTPVRGGGQCGSPQLAPASPAPGPHPATTPQGTRPPGCKYVTPKNLVMNPFDHGVDHLHLPAYMSPGFFSVTSTPASADKVLHSVTIKKFFFKCVTGIYLREKLLWVLPCAWTYKMCSCNLNFLY